MIHLQLHVKGTCSVPPLWSLCFSRCSGISLFCHFYVNDVYIEPPRAHGYHVDDCLYIQWEGWLWTFLFLHAPDGCHDPKKLTSVDQIPATVTWCCPLPNDDYRLRNMSAHRHTHTCTDTHTDTRAHTRSHLLSWVIVVPVSMTRKPVENRWPSQLNQASPVVACIISTFDLLNILFLSRFLSLHPHSWEEIDRGTTLTAVMDQTYNRERHRQSDWGRESKADRKWRGSGLR